MSENNVAKSMRSHAHIFLIQSPCGAMAIHLDLTGPGPHIGYAYVTESYYMTNLIFTKGPEGRILFSML